MASNSKTSAQVLSEIMQASLHKDPALAAKQARLLQKLGANSSSEPLDDSNNSAPSGSRVAKAQKSPPHTNELQHLTQDPADAAAKEASVAARRNQMRPVSSESTTDDPQD